MTGRTGDSSALLNLVDPGEDEINISSEKNTMNYEQNEDTFIDMNTDTDHLLGDSSPTNPKKGSIFSFGYYQSLFDIDTDDIVSRLAWSSFPRPNFTSNFAKDKIKSKPDLYGPFWICVTLIFSVAIAGNVASYFQYRFVAQENAKPDQHWHYNFHKVTLSATIVFLYATLVPSGLFGALWSSTPKDSPIKPSLIELVCIFGYSLAPFVPASVLWLIQISSIQWIVVLISFLVSGGVLALAIWPIVNEFSGNTSKGYTLVAIILGLHLLLACGFMLCFFHVPSNSNSVIIAADSTAHKNVTMAANRVEEIKSNIIHEDKREIIKNDNEKEKAMPLKKDLVNKETNKASITREVNNQDLDEKNITTKASVKKALDENIKVA